MNISIHKALTGLDYIFDDYIISYIISIHKALTGLDTFLYLQISIIKIFQSTRPSRASTHICEYFLSISLISIHKALTGLDK